MTTRRDRRATRVVRRLHHDRDLTRRFRAAPHDLLADAGLSPAQTGAVLSGRWDDLAAVGIDPARVRRRPLGMSLRARMATVLAGAVALLAGPLLSTPASGARTFGRFVRLDARRIRRADARRIAARRFAGRVVLRARLLGPGQGGCDKLCIDVEIIP